MTIAARTKPAGKHCYSLTVGSVLLVTFAIHFVHGEPIEKRKSDGALTSWGSDHVGKKLPEFVSGDECLFCHRQVVAPLWPTNRHNLSLRRFDSNTPVGKRLREETPNLVPQIDYVLGDARQLRFLRRSKKYGKLDLSPIRFHPALPKADQLSQVAAAAKWDMNQFAQRCAGCHASGVESETAAFSATSIECFTCHGDVNLRHSRNAKDVLFSKRSNHEPRVVVATCGQCHLRGGKSRSTSRPYPNQFVAGDNLFRDFQVNWSRQRLKTLDPIEQHILVTTRDAALGASKVTCLDCHNVHRPTKDKHQAVAESNVCWTCHQRGRPRSEVRKFVRRSRICDY